MLRTAKVNIAGGDRDCSSGVDTCCIAAGVLPEGTYMWTGNERGILTSHGFVSRPLTSPQRGDILWREGHTEVYLGNGMCGGPRIDENGTIYGSKKGDQTGNEVAKSAYKPSQWTYLYCYEGSKTLNGIPVPEVIAQVMEHLIDHSAHGYSQPNRDGDGTIETITIKWDDGSTSWIPVTKPFQFTFSQQTNVRTSPDPSRSDNLMSKKWKAGQTATFDGIAFSPDGRYQYGTYIGPTTGKRLYAVMADVSYGVPNV